MEQKIKKALVISWAMPPILLPRSLQVARLLSAMSLLGWDLHVITCNPESADYFGNLDEELEAIYKNCFDIVRVPEANGTKLEQDELMYSWLVYAEDYALQRLKETHFSLLLTFAQPWVDHLVGASLKKKTGIPWVAHFSDPWVDNPYYHRIEKKKMDVWKKMEKEVIRNADGIVFTNTRTQSLVMKKYPFWWKNKTWIMNHGFDAYLINKSKSEMEMDAELKLAYIGDLYGKRDPEWLLLAIKQLADRHKNSTKRVKLHLAGWVAPEYKEKIQYMIDLGLVEYYSRISYMESLNIAAKANILVVIDMPGTKESPFLPSKIVDYLAYRKPILGLTPAKGAVAELLNKLECPFVDPYNSTAIFEALEKIWNTWEKGDLGVSKKCFDSVSREYDIQGIAEKFEIQLSKRIL